MKQHKQRPHRWIQPCFCKERRKQVADNTRGAWNLKWQTADLKSTNTEEEEHTLFSSDGGRIYLPWIECEVLRCQRTVVHVLHVSTVVGFTTHQDWITNRRQNHWSTTLTARYLLKAAAKGGRRGRLYPLWNENKADEHDWIPQTEPETVPSLLRETTSWKNVQESQQSSRRQASLNVSSDKVLIYYLFPDVSKTHENLVKISFICSLNWGSTEWLLHVSSLLKRNIHGTSAAVSF